LYLCGYLNPAHILRLSPPGGGRLIALGYVLINPPSHIREDLDFNSS
jgi:hypothetical protein